jgi:hypothetical protein
MMTAYFPLISAQGPSTTTTNATTTMTNATTALTIYQSDADHFRIGVYDGWVIEDYDNTAVESQNRESEFGLAALATICPEEQASLNMNGTYECHNGASPALSIIRFGGLDIRPEFFDIIQQNGSITIDDFVKFTDQYVTPQVGGVWDLTVNVTDPRTNQTVSTESGKAVSYTKIYAAVLSSSTNTGYLFVANLSPESTMSNLTKGEMGRQMDEMNRSFELLLWPLPLE